ncbi:MAG: hypothetical protein EAZ92_11135 [Candidatus Kapaibacterium sp.]|nr:MAG: hypothetical protein EAZ92_11135 [Candidatus Kapabacteria bacterium]
MKPLQYFECTPSAEPHIAGTFHQIDGMRKGACPVGEFIERLYPQNWDTLPPEFTFVLKRKAKWTDLMSCAYSPGYVGMLVSEAAQNLLSTLQLPPHRWLETKVVYARDRRKYFILNYGDAPVINYPESLFRDEIEKISLTFQSYNEWVEYAKAQVAPPLIRFTRLVLDAPIDLLKRPFQATPIVSEGLKKAVEESGLVGFEFEPVRMEIVGSA